MCTRERMSLMAMKRIVISLGGSVLVPSLEENHIREYATILRDLGKEHRISVVVGGGGEARRYIGVARELGIDESTADELGILVTRLNAALLAGTLGEAAYPKIAESYRDAAGFGETGKIVVMGGVIPGQTTDAVAALLAERIRADLIINWTSVDGIYSADPRKHPGAVRHSVLTPGELQAIIREDRLEAGSNTVFDTLAAKIVGRSGIPLVVLDGRKPGDPRKAIRGKRGTLVSDGKGWREIAF
jgi:uridylate kinase